MDTPNHSPQLQICPLHNQLIILQDIQTNKNVQRCICPQNKERAQADEIQQQYQDLTKEISQDKQQLLVVLDEILNYKKNINQNLDNIVQVIGEHIAKIDQFKKNQQQLISSLNNTSFNIQNLKQDVQNLKQSNLIIKNQVKSQLHAFQLEHCKIDQVLISLENIKVQLEKPSKKFKYELIQESRKKERERCHAFAFNKEENILLVACGIRIFIYQFFNGQIVKELQKVFHADLVYSQLKEHKKQVLTVLMNRNEDLLISGSYDNTVNFWKQINKLWSCQQTIDLKDYSCSLSLNDQENKLISCGQECAIQVMQLQTNDSWSIVQAIKVVEKGFSLSFLDQNLFVFQPVTKDFLELYNYDYQQKQFYKSKQIQIQSCAQGDWFFPIQFMRNLKIITIKHGNFLKNIFNMNDDGDLNLMQTIEFEIYGILSDDGKYLATWNQKLGEIRVSKLRYLK